MVIAIDFDGTITTCPQVVERVYLASAEPREKRIAELQLELKKKRLAIKNRNTRIKNLKASLTGTQNTLEKRNKQLAEAKEIIDIFLDFESTCQERGVYISDEIRKKARQFKENTIK